MPASPCRSRWAAESLLNSSSGTLTLNGAIDENGFPLTLEADNGPTTLNGQVSGSGGLVKVGGGEVVLAVANTYSGTTQINAGTLDIQNALSLGATDGTVATETTVNGGTLTLDGSFTVSNDLLTLANGTLQSNGNAGWADNVDLAGNYDDYFSPSGGDTLTLSGNVTGSAYVEEYSGGLLVLQGTDTFTMDYVYESTLEVDGSLSRLNRLEGGTLQGSGTIAGGTFYYGYNGPNYIYSTGTIGDINNINPSTLTIDPAGPMATGILDTGSLDMGGEGTLAFELNGDTAGSGYDQLQAAGTVNVGGTDLQVTLGYTPSVGQQFTLIENNSGAAVAGTFNGLGEGSLLVVGGVVFQISYLGGASGNDVTLTRVAADVWTGGGADNHWSTAANWAGDTAPSAGDNLIFPSGPTKTSTNNDFAAGTAFGSIAISGSGYTLAGNAVTLETGLSDSGGNATVSLPITLGAAESLLNSSSGTLTLNGAIDENGFPLTLEADNGPTTVNGQVSGSGGLVKAGYGEVVLAVANTYTGTTQVNAGTLDIQNAQSLGATDGTAATETTVNGGTLTLDGSFAVSNDLLTLTNGTLQSNGNAGWADNVDLAGNYDDYFSPSGGDTLTLSGNVTGSAYVEEYSGGLLVLQGTDTFTMDYVYESTLEVDGSLSRLNRLEGGTLQGSGTIAGGTFYYGYNGPNYIYSTGTIGDINNINPSTLTIDPAGPMATGILDTGSLDMGGEGTLAFELNGDTAGSGYDQLQAAGTVNVGGTDLQVTLGYTPSVGQQFTLIENNSGAAVAGTFNGLGEGSLLVVGNVVFQISYLGGTSGNDVTLTVLDHYPATAVIATGGFSFAATEGTNSAVQTVATFTDPDPSTLIDYQAMVDWGDHTSSIATVANGGIVQSGGTFYIKLRHDYAEEGSDTITTFITHEGLDSNTVTSTATVADAPLTAGVVSASGGVAGSTATTLSATFTDGNPEAPTSDFSGTINWGDGSPSTPDITTFTSSAVTGSDGSYTVSGSHQYATAGSHDITVTINDVGDSSTSDTGSTTVSKAPTSISGVTASQSVTYGTSSITLGGTVSQNGSGIYPTGTVKVCIDGVNATSTSISSANGSFSATFNPSAIPASATAYTISYSYGGDSNYDAANNTSTTLTVDQAPTSTTLSATATTLVYGNSDTFTATVSSPVGPPSVGTVTFMDGATQLAQVTLDSADLGVATLTEPRLPAGFYVVTASYSDTVDSNFTASTSPAGPITTVAGDGDYGYSGDNRAATAAELSIPKPLPWMPRGTSSSPTPTTTGSARWSRPPERSSPWRATALTATTATGSRPPPPNCRTHSASPWIPRGTSSSPT